MKKILWVILSAMVVVGWLYKHERVSISNETSSSGALSARMVEITPELSGHIKAILFTDGAFVKAGAPLVQLDDAVLKAKYAYALAKYRYSLNNYQRIVSLGKQGAVSRQAIDQAEAEWQERKAEAEEAAVMLNKMVLRAPSDGRMSKCKVNVGDYVSFGQGIASLTNTQFLRVEYQLPEQWVGLVKQGQLIKVIAAAYPAKIFYAHVAYISPSIDVNHHTVDLYAELQDRGHMLKPGMQVNVYHCHEMS